ncbi:2-oxo-4-hydroxy-4-carboxy-5-ureidoimidazoline decarboxylase [Streptomyces sp. NPDC018031]|uniref:2-oxo-4-hydroxy-4-carboxy-5-ureidoimidazoline decarboxylase n=1 Tax=Streptomyces sp. NPDC018031 TaxID=3365033 RepID=UPI003796FED2
MASLLSQMPHPPRAPEEPTLSSDTPAPPPPAPGGIPGRTSAPVPPRTPVPPRSRVPLGLARFNTAPARAAEAALLGCCGSRRWARRIASRRPYPDLGSLLAAGERASAGLSAADLAEALAREPAQHPLSGARQASRLAARTALTAAHAEYERKFGHVFVICLDALDPAEALDAVLAGIHTRLGHPVEKETAVAADELRRIAQGRLARLVAPHHGVSGIGR